MLHLKKKEHYCKISTFFKIKLILTQFYSIRTDRTHRDNLTGARTLRSEPKILSSNLPLKEMSIWFLHIDMMAFFFFCKKKNEN